MIVRSDDSIFAWHQGATVREWHASPAPGIRYDVHRITPQSRRWYAKLNGEYLLDRRGQRVCNHFREIKDHCEQQYVAVFGTAGQAGA